MFTTQLHDEKKWRCTSTPTCAIVACKGISLLTGEKNKDEKKNTVRGFFKNIN